MESEEELEDEDLNECKNVKLKTANEINETIKLCDVKVVPNELSILPLGIIFSVVGQQVVVQAYSHLELPILDVGSLLCFSGERKVLGEIFDVFGPTTQPFYSTMASIPQMSASSIQEISLELGEITNPEPPPTATPCLSNKDLSVGREVWYCSEKSEFVFTQELKRFKGSDASNVYDEEVGEDEAEFSDDEAEMLYKKKKKDARRPNSIKSTSQLNHSASYSEAQGIQSKYKKRASTAQDLVPFGNSRNAQRTKRSYQPYQPSQPHQPYHQQPYENQQTDVMSSANQIMNSMMMQQQQQQQQQLHYQQQQYYINPQYYSMPPYQNGADMNLMTMPNTGADWPLHPHLYPNIYMGSYPASQSSYFYPVNQ